MIKMNKHNPFSEEENAIRLELMAMRFKRVTGALSRVHVKKKKRIFLARILSKKRKLKGRFFWVTY